MAHKPAHIACPARKQLAVDLLHLLELADQEPEIVKSVQYKVAALFQSMLEAVVRTGGELDPDLYKLFVRVSRLMAVDTQEIEGLNSVIKHVIGRSPSIGLELLSSRVASKKVLSDVITARPGPETLAAVENRVQECAAIRDEACKALQDRDRYYRWAEQSLKMGEVPPLPPIFSPMESAAAPLCEEDRTPEAPGVPEPGPEPGEHPDNNVLVREAAAPPAAPRAPRRKKPRLAKCVARMYARSRAILPEKIPTATKALLVEPVRCRRSLGYEEHTAWLPCF